MRRYIDGPQPSNNAVNRRNFATLLASAPLFGSDWPSFRGPQGSGIGPKGDPPVNWTAGQLLWKTAIPGIGHSSPVVWGDRVYVFTAVAAGESAIDMSTHDKVVFAKDTVPHTWKLLTLDRASGRILWQTDVHQGTPRQPRHARGSYANATPATDGRYIAVQAYQDVLACLNRSGKVLWTKQVGPPEGKLFLDPASSPVFYDGMLFLLADWQKGGFLAAYEPASGREIWKAPREEGLSWTTPAGYRRPDGKSVILINSSRRIRAYLASTGEEVWRLDNQVKEPWDRIPVPVVTADHVIFTGGSPDQGIYAVRHSAAGDITLAAGAVSSEHVAWKTERGAPYMATPLVMAGLIYTVGTNGVVTAYAEKTGQRVYQERATPAGTMVSASPVGADGRVYFTSEAGEVIVVRAGHKFEVIGRGKVDDSVFATPAISGRMMLIRGLTHLYAAGRA